MHYKVRKLCHVKDIIRLRRHLLQMETSLRTAVALWQRISPPFALPGVAEQQTFTDQLSCSLTDRWGRGSEMRFVVDAFCGTAGC
ncbi:hypothetical protein ANANG_G00281820 [Anguilla anguilla]|uniref:Uncharacterized protein n=1 Tax=Anguilla anguilla TaxID=7936 RepID=A0A9D3LP93_ANGAN|nr:hypothetical protein ANANG_G00281820 [Anguilla anguilla]